MYVQKLSFDYAHTLHTVRIVHNAHSVHRSRVQKGQSCDCINFVRATDPVCGSAHCQIAAYWSQKLNKKEIYAYQASKRGGYLHCTLQGNDRITISGEAALVAISEIVAAL